MGNANAALKEKFSFLNDKKPTARKTMLAILPKAKSSGMVTSNADKR